MTQEVTTIEELLPQTTGEIKLQIQRIQEIHRSVMIKDVHYGQIPGTHKDTLYKAGSELLLTTFRIAVDPDIEDLSTDDEIRYRVTLRGIANAEMKMDTISGVLVGAGVGEASTNEEKYKWKGAMELEFDHADPERRRIKYGWRWGDQRGEKVETTTKQVRTNPADLANTVLKMAKKRAQVDLCLTALAASDVFDQDLDDSLPPGAQPEAHPKAQTEAPKPLHDAGDPGPTEDPGSAWPEHEDPAPTRRSAPAGNVATSKQIGLIKAKLYEAKQNETALLSHLKCQGMDYIPFDRVDDALAWIARA
jgi:hypothetical protein